MKSNQILLLIALGFGFFLTNTSYPRSIPADPAKSGESSVPIQEVDPKSARAVELEQGDTTQLRNAWGGDILISTGGFGLGGFYRRQFSETIYGFLSLSVSEAKDSREVQFVDPFTLQTFTPGKVNRFLVVPLLFGVQYRLFQDAIQDNFRPYLTAAAGPSIVYASPYADREEISPGVTRTREVDFFKALGRGQAHYTVGGYVGIGAFFGFERKNLLGINIRYYFVPLRSGIESFIPLGRGIERIEPEKKKEFGGFFITLNFGTQY